MQCFRIAEAPFDITSLRQHLLAHQAGAYASFEGWVRDSEVPEPAEPAFAAAG